MSKWNNAANLLREAADTIEERGTLRDVEGYADTIEVAAKISGLHPKAVLKVQLALKQARFDRSGELDSALDYLAYQARYLVEGVVIEPTKTDPSVDQDVADYLPPNCPSGTCAGD